MSPSYTDGFKKFPKTIKFDDSFRLENALALNNNTFCVVFSGTDNDDTYSYILTYEGKLRQPWSRVDVPRKIAGLTGKLNSEDRPVIYAVSDEGDVYIVSPGRPSHHTEIDGAGVYSENATGLGYINAAALVGDVVLVTGYRSQLYSIIGEKKLSGLKEISYLQLQRASNTSHSAA